MNKYVRQFLLRGLIFSGFGPVVLGIVYLCLEISNVELNLNGYQIFTAIITAYLIAFVHAGTSVFHEIESWGKAKSMLLQLLLLYSVYTIGYLINDWLKFDIKVLAIYTSCFVVGFIITWLSIYFSVKSATNKLNKKIKIDDND